MEERVHGGSKLICQNWVIFANKHTNTQTCFHCRENILIFLLREHLCILWMEEKGLYAYNSLNGKRRVYMVEIRWCGETQQYIHTDRQTDRHRQTHTLPWWEQNSILTILTLLANSFGVSRRIMFYQNYPLNINSTWSISKVHWHQRWMYSTLAFKGFVASKDIN